MIKVLLADDQAMIREAFAALLQLEAEPRGGRPGGRLRGGGRRQAPKTDPDVVLMDVQMPSVRDR